MSYEQEPYDPSEVDERPRSDHFTRRDVRKLAFVVAIVAILMIPVYMSFRRVAEAATCLANFNGIHTALGVYMANNDDHFPPVCDQHPNLSPVLYNGRPSTWASVIKGGMEKRHSFRCPSASADEVVHADDGHGGDLPMTYGMYSAWSGAATANIANTSEAIVITETSNHGSADSYNPAPFVDMEGNEVAQDGFLIGWDGGNYVYWSGATSAVDMPKHVTRLAFRNTAGGLFGDKAYSRHNDGIHALYVDGHIGVIKPFQAKVRYTDVGGFLSGEWSTRGWPGGWMAEAARQRQRLRKR